MKWPMCRTVLVAGLLSLVPSWTWAEDVTTRDTFLREYPVALKRLRDRYSRVHGSLTTTIQSSMTKAGNSKSRRSNTRFYFDGENRKVQSIQAADNEMRRDPYSRTRCATPTLAFVVEMEKPGGTPVLKFLTGGGVNHVSGATKIFHERYVNMPFSPFVSMAVVLNNPAFELVDVESFERDGRKLIRARYNFMNNPRPTKEAAAKQSLMQFALTFDPSREWTLQDYELKVEDKVSTTKYEYAIDQSGHWIPTRSISSTPIQTETNEYEEFTFGPTSSNEFTLESMNLPNALTSPGISHSRSRLSIWLIVLGVSAACLALLLGMSLRYRRRSVVGHSKQS